MEDWRVCSTLLDSSWEMKIFFGEKILFSFFFLFVLSRGVSLTTRVEGGSGGEEAPGIGRCGKIISRESEGAVKFLAGPAPRGL